MNKSPENFILNEENQLYLPVGADANRPWTATASHQEIIGQREVFGIDGHGSIRNETVDSSLQSNGENLDDAVKQMLDPANIIDLKEKLETKVSKLNDESTHKIDKRLDKDGEVLQNKKDLRSTIKSSLINQYSQIGADKESPREVPESVIGDISRMLDMSFDELESKINANSKSNPEQNPVEPTTNSNADSSTNSKTWTSELPDMSTRVKDQVQFDAMNVVMIDAVKSGDSDQFERAYRYFQHEVAADRIISGEKHEKFEDEMSVLREIMESNKNSGSSTALPIPTVRPRTDEGLVVEDEFRNLPNASLYDFEDEEQSDGDVLPVPVIIVNDEEPVIVELSSENPPVAAVEEKKRWKKSTKLAAGIIAVVGVFGIGALLGNNSDEDSSAPAPTTVEEPDATPASVEEPAVTPASVEEPDAAAQAEADALEQSLKDRTVEIADTQGDTSWDRATTLYGDQASIRLIQASEAVAADGIEVRWTEDPYTSKTADLFVNGTNDPSIVWQFLAPRLAKQDMNNLLQNAEVGEEAQSTLPATE